MSKFCITLNEYINRLEFSNVSEDINDEDLLLAYDRAQGQQLMDGLNSISFDDIMFAEIINQEDLRVRLKKDELIIKNIREVQEVKGIQPFMKTVISKLNRPDKFFLESKYLKPLSLQIWEVQYSKKRDALDSEIWEQFLDTRTNQKVMRRLGLYLNDDQCKDFNDVDLKEIKGITIQNNNLVIDGLYGYLVIHDWPKVRSLGILDEFFKKVDQYRREEQKTTETTTTRENKYSTSKDDCKLGWKGWVMTGALMTVMAAMIFSNPKNFPIIDTDDYEDEDTERIVYTTTTEDRNYQDSIIPVITAQHNNNTASPNVTDNTIPNIDEIPDVGEEITNEVFIDYSDRSTSSKVSKTRELYYDSIEKYANMYGIDPELILCIATQERGIHSSTMDKGGGIGLMQIQVSVWKGKTLEAYNCITGEKDKIQVTEAALGDCDTNIRMGCMILRRAIDAQKGNLLLALQGYNMGGGTLNKILNKCAQDTGQTVEDIKNNPNNISWLEYRTGHGGDPQYIEHVISYGGPSFNTYCYDHEGNRHELCIKNYEYANNNTPNNAPAKTLS